MAFCTRSPYAAKKRPVILHVGFTVKLPVERQAACVRMGELQKYNTTYSRVVTHHSTDVALRSLACKIGRVCAFSSRYGRICREQYIPLLSLALTYRDLAGWMFAASFGLIYAWKPPPLIQNLCPEQVSYASKQILGPQSGHGWISHKRLMYGSTVSEGNKIQSNPKTIGMRTKNAAIYSSHQALSIPPYSVWIKPKVWEM